VDARPELRAQRALLGALYAGHPYGQPATGEDVGALGETDVEDWVEEVHRPGNAVAVIAGEFDPKQVEALVRDSLGDWGGRGAEVALPPVPPLPEPSAKPTLLFTPRPGATQGSVQLACRLPGTAPEAAARYALMAELVQLRLWREVRERMGASYGFHAGTSLARGGAAHLLVEGVVDAAQLKATLAVASGTLEGYARDGVPAPELERARARLLARHAVALTTSEEWVDALLEARVLGWEAEAVTRRPELLQAVTSADLQKEFAGCAGRLVVNLMADEGAVR
jgi:zinc protease